MTNECNSCFRRWTDPAKEGCQRKDEHQNEPPMLECQHCGATDVMFEYSAVVMVGFRDYALTTVECGGVFGGLPDTVTCGTCGGSTNLNARPDLAGEATEQVLAQSNLTDDGFVIIDRRTQ